jgi:hypothetical protein
VPRAHPDKFALVKPVNPDDPAVADVIADWKKTAGTVGIRIIMTRESKRAPDDPGFDRILRSAARADFPVNVLFWGNIDAGTALRNLSNWGGLSDPYQPVLARGGAFHFFAAWNADAPAAAQDHDTLPPRS